MYLARGCRTKYVSLEIYYNGMGIVREPSLEEMEELFQEHLQNRKSMLVESAGSYYNKGERDEQNALI